MTERRWPWSAAAGLLLAATIAAGYATYLYWLPCRGAMLSGTIVRGYAYGPDFGAACLRRMDTGMPFPYPPEPVESIPGASSLGLVAMVLAASAWLAVVLPFARPGRPMGLMALPSALTLALAGYTALGPVDADLAAGIVILLSVLSELLALVAATVLIQERGSGRRAIAVLAVAWASTGFGFVHQAADFIAMTIFSDANWDVPPGAGYLTIAGLAISALLALAYAIRGPAPARRREPGLVDRSA